MEVEEVKVTKDKEVDSAARGKPLSFSFLAPKSSGFVFGLGLLSLVVAFPSGSEEKRPVSSGGDNISAS